MDVLKGLFAFIVGSSIVTFVFALIWGVFFLIGALLWPYSINSWLVYAENDPVITWWMGGLMGMFPALGPSCIPVAFITFIIMLFIGG